MKRRVAPNDPLVRRIKKWKKDQGIISLTLDELKKKVKGQDVIIEQKVDGQSALLRYEDREQPQFASLGGVVLSDLPVLYDIFKILKGHGIKTATMVGELAGYDKGKIIPFNETMSLIKNPGSDKTKVHWFPYQILEMDGEEFGEGFETYMKTWPQLKKLFLASRYVHPVEDYRGVDNIDKAWKKLVEKDDNEGIVLRASNNKVYKCKPMFSYDLVIIAVGDMKGKNWPKGKIGTTLMAFMDKNGVFRSAGHIGTGWSDAESKELFTWAHNNAAQGEENAHEFWVKPKRIMEVQWERTTIKDMPAYKYARGKYESAGKFMSGTIVKPRFIRYRGDKSVNPSDLRLTQIPNWKGKEKMASKVIDDFLKKHIPEGYKCVNSPEELERVEKVLKQKMARTVVASWIGQNT